MEQGSVKSLKNLDRSALENKRVLTRVDFNVPLDKDLNITDDSRIQAALETIRYLVNSKAKVILVSHLGRPKARPDDRLRLDPIAKHLSKLLGQEIIKLDEAIGPNVKAAIAKLTNGQACMLENIRFYEGEEKNDVDFSKQLADLADVYVNDAFGTAHRAHASTAGVASYLSPAVAGFLMEQELEMLGSKLDHPERPFTAIIGGAKISSKITVLESLVKKVDTLLIGGGMAYTFLKARGASIGKSLCEVNQIDTARDIMSLADENNVALILPEDTVCTPAIDESGAAIDFFTVYNTGDKVPTKTFSSKSIDPKWQGMDIGPASAVNFIKLIGQSRTILWNGPLGVFEYDSFEHGTKVIAEALINLTQKGGTTIIGGGDSVAALEKFSMPKAEFTHVSTGGGASLEFLEGKILPGVACLDRDDKDRASTVSKPKRGQFEDQLAKHITK